MPPRVLAPVPALAPVGAHPDRRRLDVTETLRLAGIRSPHTLRKYWREGKFPTPVRTTSSSSARLFWYEDEVLAYLDLARVLTVQVTDPDMDDPALELPDTSATISDRCCDAGAAREEEQLELIGLENPGDQVIGDPVVGDPETDRLVSALGY